MSKNEMAGKIVDAIVTIIPSLRVDSLDLANEISKIEPFDSETISHMISNKFLEITGVVYASVYSAINLTLTQIYKDEPEILLDERR